MAENTDSPDPLEWLKRLMVPPGLGPSPVPLPIFDSAEIDRRIVELRAVEGWMQAQLELLQLSIQTLEMQRGALNAMGAAQDPHAETAPPNPLEAWTQMLRQFQAAADAAKPK
ncbi:MAG TPA: PhaM family polyhydroxyalkanoate granule multifunctional regulatory protein [Burkholderiales bacterium]|jgi:hypothetical protein